MVAEVAYIVSRYSLARILIGYGLAKVLHQQMPAPTAFRLMETYGESSPMGLLWTFIGQSAAYSAYTGGLEMLAGSLLLFRRTTAIGALLAAMILFNVLVLNLCYDVPVELYSATLFFLAAVLAAPGFMRVLGALMQTRSAAPASSDSSPFKSQVRIRRWARLIGKTAVTGWMF